MCAYDSRQQLFNRYSGLAQQQHPGWDEDVLRSIQYFQVDMAAEQGALLDSVDRVTKWIQTVRDLEEFVTAESRLPRENNRLPRIEVSRKERSLADWVTYQRRPASRDLHCTYQQERLETVAGFLWDPVEAQWDAMFTEFAKFIALNHRAPRYRSTDPGERTLASWAAKQRHRSKHGSLPANRRRKLASLTINVVARRHE